MPVEEAAELVDALVEREVPLVWKVGGKKRVLDPKMSMKDKTLLLLHSSTGPVPEARTAAISPTWCGPCRAGDCGGGRLACASGRSRHPT